MAENDTETWKIWIDRGTTFTGTAARKAEGAMLTHKLVSGNPAQDSAAAKGIEEAIGCVYNVKRVKNDEIEL